MYILLFILHTRSNKEEKNMKIANFIAWVILLIGGLVWLLIGIASWNLIGAIFGPMGVVARIIYTLVGLSAIWLLISPLVFGGRISLWNSKRSKE